MEVTALTILFLVGRDGLRGRYEAGVCLCWTDEEQLGALYMSGID